SSQPRLVGRPRAALQNLDAESRSASWQSMMKPASWLRCMVPSRKFLLSGHLTDIHRMAGFPKLILSLSTAIGKHGGLLGAKVGDGSAFCARNIDFAFIWTHLSHAFGSNAWINESLMPAPDQAAAAVPRLGAECQQRGLSGWQLQPSGRRCSGRGSPP